MLNLIIVYASYLLDILYLSRGQRDIEGEREARLREIEQLEEQIRRVDREVATAETEKSQFQAAQRRTEDFIYSHRYSPGVYSVERGDTGKLPPPPKMLHFT